MSRHRLCFLSPLAWGMDWLQNCFHCRPDDVSHSFYLFLFSFFSGLYIVPQISCLQLFSDKKETSRVIAANNILNAFFMVAGSVILTQLFAKEIPVPQIFLLMSVAHLMVIFSRSQLFPLTPLASGALKD